MPCECEYEYIGCQKKVIFSQYLFLIMPQQLRTRLPLPSAYIARAIISQSHMLSLVNVLSSTTILFKDDDTF